MSWIHRQVIMSIAPELARNRAFVALCARSCTCLQRTEEFIDHLHPLSGRCFRHKVDRVQTWHRHRYRKRARAVSDQAVEAYLREDVPCGFPTCTLCNNTLPQLPKAASHLVIPDAHTLESCLEVFELPEMHSVIYMTSAVKQVSPHVQPSHQHLYSPPKP